MVDYGSYFGAPMEDVNSCPGVSDSGSGQHVRGPIDIFFGCSNLRGAVGDFSDDRGKGTQTMSRTIECNHNYLFKLFDKVVEEIGEKLVVQVVSDYASAYMAVGKMLMEKRKHLFSTSCAAHCLNLMLKKLGDFPQHKSALQKAKKVSNFIYNHGWVLHLTRKFAKRDIVRPAATRFVTAYLTLENDRYFWSSVVDALKTTKPLVDVLRMIDSEKEPAMGYIHDAMDLAKELIAKNLGGEESAYKEIWKIIDDKWDFQLHQDLHDATYYLNHRFNLYACIERLTSKALDFNLIDAHIDSYCYKQDMFGMRALVTSYKTLAWCDQFGDGTKELKSLAMRILGLTLFENKDHDGDGNRANNFEYDLPNSPNSFDKR
ncbi:hypothetical protein UlMin_004665 [Ulmus minor]